LTLGNKRKEESVSNGNTLAQDVSVHDSKYHKLQGMSIIVSGWPAVGKSTVAAALADEFGLKMYNGGDILKQIATDRGYDTSENDWWDSDQGRQFMKERRSDMSFDVKVDNQLKDILRRGNAIVTSYTLPWLVLDDCIKVWLQGSQANRATRMASRDHISLDQAAAIVKERDCQNKEIYETIYGFKFGMDLSVFDFSLNTDLMDLTSLVQILKDIIRNVKITLK
jgi:CMP/dCMP kinase